MRRALSNLGRLRQITAVVARHGLGHYMARRRYRASAGSSSDRLDAAQGAAWRLRNVLQELGPTFIKFGQVLSARADLLPPAFVAALTSLQDHCDAMPFAQVEAAVSACLGKPIAEAFSHFDAEPVACASIAQVHRATTRTGVVVAVKVQRVGIRARIEQDLDLLAALAQLIENIIEESGMLTPRGVVREFQGALMGELDFRREARMLDRFGAKCREHARTYEVPEIYHALSGETVLTMGFVTARRINDVVSPADKKMVAQNIVRAAFDQIFIDGLFHADPHPGNCFVRPDNRLTLIDFGAVGQISYAMRETLVVLVLSVAIGDADAIARLFYRIGKPERGLSLHQLRDACASLLTDKFSDRHTVAQIGATEVFSDLFALAARFGVRVPSEYALVARASVTVEGIIRQLDPQLEVLDHVKPILRNLIEEQFTLPKLGNTTLKNLLRARALVREVPLTLSQILMDLEHGVLRLEIDNASLGLIARNIDTLGVVVFMGLVACGLVSGSLSLLARYDVEFWGLPVVSSVGLCAANLLFGLTLGRYFLAPRLKKISVVKRWRRRRR